jgi:hypothetical protein
MVEVIALTRADQRPRYSSTLEACMTREEASKQLISAVIVTREDIARAKQLIVTASETDTDGLAEEWLTGQVGDVPKQIDLHAATIDDNVGLLARAYSLRLAYYQAVWELVPACELLPSGTESWRPSVDAHDPSGTGGLQLDSISCVFPHFIQRPPLRSNPQTDPDVFLQGAQSAALHDGIREAVGQSLACFRRGLHLPAIVMLAAGAEAAWIQCGSAVAAKLGNRKLGDVIQDPFASISRKVAEVRRSLEGPASKDLLKAAGTSLARVTDAELWTTTLRERRNAVHWGKMQSFIAQHSDASSLLLAAPLHLGTLEAVRIAAA